MSLFLSGLLIWFPIACTTGFSAPVSLREELGSSPTLSVLFPRDDGDLVYFDPLGLANDENFARYREAELKHGRVAMVAVIGSVIPTYYSEIIHSNHGNDVLSIFLKVPALSYEYCAAPHFSKFSHFLYPSGHVTSSVTLS